MTKSITDILKKSSEDEVQPIIPEEVQPTISAAEDNYTITTYEGEAVLDFSHNEKSPADWKIEPNSDDSITAIHNSTRKVFVGTTKQFSQVIR